MELTIPQVQLSNHRGLSVQVPALAVKCGWLDPETSTPRMQSQPAVLVGNVSYSMLNKNTEMKLESIAIYLDGYGWIACGGLINSFSDAAPLPGYSVLIPTPTPLSAAATQKEGSLRQEVQQKEAEDKVTTVSINIVTFSLFPVENRAMDNVSEEQVLATGLSGWVCDSTYRSRSVKSDKKLTIAGVSLALCQSSGSGVLDRLSPILRYEYITIT